MQRPLSAAAETGCQDLAVSRGYPAHREADVVLRDGSTVRLRPVRDEDEAALRELFAGLGDRSLAFRFFSGAVNLDEAAQRMVAVDQKRSFGLVALRGEGNVVGHAVYVETVPGEAEVAFAIGEPMQGRGLGTILLAHLAERAGECGIGTFVAEVMPQNHRMIDVFRDSGFAVATESVAGGIRLAFPTSFSAEATARFADRDRLAAAAAVRSFLEPRSVAVVGASRRRGTVGGEVLHNMRESGFPGRLYAVNRAAEGEVQGTTSFPRLAAIPGEVELAVLAVPAAAVPAAAGECAAKGVRALLVLSAGFKETGEAGAERERELREICRRSGMRLVGPNCLGVLSTAPEAPLNATFAPTAPAAGRVGFVTQSGALGLALMEFAAGPGLGVSSFASVGNRADITANDLLEYWESDARTRVALLYIESFSDPRRFSRVARRVGAELPIAVVKSGRSAAGARAASSHTGALLAGSERASEALFEEAGVIRTESVDELLAVAALLSEQPLPAGPRVGIVTNAGGPGIMCADACEAAGLEVPELPAAMRRRLRRFLPAEAGLGNPVDMIATAPPEHYRRTIEALAAWEGIDALIAIFIRPLLTEAGDVAAALREAHQNLERPIPVQAVFISPHRDDSLARRSGVPTHTQPEQAARALGKAVRHSRWRQRHDEDEEVDLGPLRADEAAATIAEALAVGREWLSAEQCLRLLDCYGVAVPASRVVTGPLAAGEAAAALGGPVALKAGGPGILHKTELGAVAVGLEGAAAVERAAAAMEERLSAAGLEPETFLVQAMVEGDAELLVGVAADPVFGPVLACGAGGTAAELLGDVAIRLCPLSAGEAARMLASLRTFPLLTGYRGAPPADLDAVRELLLRVSALADGHHEIVELDLNPVLAGPDGALAADARIRVAAAAPPRPWPRTWA